MRLSGLVVMVALVGGCRWCGGGGTEPPDAPAGPAISAVATVGGFTEIRQGADPVGDNYADRIVITGTQLADVTSVTVGPYPATIASATATEVQVDLYVPHGAPPAAYAVTASGPGWTATSPNTIAITYVIVSPAGTLDGRGTNQSPATLCSPLLSYAYDGDRIEMGAGTHTCNSAVAFLAGPGADIRGAGVGTTIVAPGFGGFLEVYAPSSHPTRLSDITFQDPVTVLSFMQGFPSNQVVLERLQITGGGPTIFSLEDGQLAATDISYSGTGTVFALDFVFGSITSSTITGCAIGVHLLDGGDLSVSGVSITGCQTGVLLGDPASFVNDEDPVMALDDASIEAGLPIDMRSGILTVNASDLQSTGSYGIQLSRGWISLVGGTTAVGPVGGLAAVGQPDHVIRLETDGAELTGGTFGIQFYAADYGHIILRDTRAEGGSYGLDLSQYEEQATVDLGTAASPGNNQLVGGTYAYFEHGTPAWPNPYSAIGTTLNGNSYAGQLLVGPVALSPDYDIVQFGSTIQF